MYLIAKGGRNVTQKLTFFKENHEQVRRIFGNVIFLTALSIYIGADKALQAWTLQVLPSAWTQLAGNFEQWLHVTPLLRQLRRQ